MTVLVVDLREEYAAVTEQPHFNYYVRTRIPSDADIDISRVIVIDDAPNLLRHGDAFARILNSASVRHLMCVAVGMAVGMADPDGPVAVTLPSILRNQNTTVLWVGDTGGIAWDTRRGPASIVRNTTSGGDTSSLGELLEAVTTEAVFDWVREHVAAMPSHVANPGIRMLSNQVDPATLAVEQARAIRTLTDGVGELSDTPVGGPDLSALEHRFGIPDRVLPGGRLGAARARADAALGAAEAVLDSSTRPWGLLIPTRGRSVPRLAAEAVRALTEYGELMRSIFILGDQGSDAQRRDRLRSEGVELATPPRDPPAVVDDVRRTIGASAESGQPTEQLVKQLYAVATGLVPMGSAARVGQVDEVCSPTRLAALATIPAIRGGLGGPIPVLCTLLAPLLVGVALIGAWPDGIAPVGVRAVATEIAPVALAVLTLVVGALVVRLKRGALGVARRRPWRDVGVVLATLALAATLPAVLFGVAATANPVPGLTPLSGRIVIGLVGVGATLALLAPLIWWYVLVRRWPAARSIAALRQVWTGLDTTYDAAVTEWVQTDARLQASDMVRALAGALDSTGMAFNSYAKHLAAEWPAPAGPPASGAVGALVRHDLAAVLLWCLDSFWAEAKQGHFDAISERAGNTARARLAEYWNHTRRFGLQQLPREWPARPDRDRLAVAWWRGTAQLRDAIRTDGPVRQLCSDEQAQLLSREGGRSAVTRFAPRGARQAMTEPDETGWPAIAAPDELVWTDSGTAAGVVHLVPVRAGVTHEQMEDR